MSSCNAEEEIGGVEVHSDMSGGSEDMFRSFEEKINLNDGVDGDYLDTFLSSLSPTTPTVKTGEDHHSCPPSNSYSPSEQDYDCSLTVVKQDRVISKRLEYSTEEETISSIASLRITEKECLSATTLPTPPNTSHVHTTQSDGVAPHTYRRKGVSSDSESEEDAFEKFLDSVKKTVRKKSLDIEQEDDLYKFVVDDSEEEEEEGSEGSEGEGGRSPSPGFYRRVDVITDSVSDTEYREIVTLEEEDNEVFLKSPTPPEIVFEPKKRKSTKKLKGRMKTFSASTETSSAEEEESRGVKGWEEEFLESLSDTFPSHRRAKDAERFVNSFKRNRTELVAKLYQIYNTSVFSGELPPDMSVTWNVRLRKTAGFCALRKELDGKKTARIELSDKVCDSAVRVRDTLVHEMSHAAVWIISGVKDPGHGRTWKLWSQKAKLTFPCLPDVSRCHSYQIQTKFTYRCTKCAREVHRHSKSVDTNRKVCGGCHGQLELLVNGKKKANGSTGEPATPRQPPKFALFVKENYSSVKKSGGSLTHKEVMGLLGEKFKSKVSLD